jgi:hypothetical protein
MFPEYFLMLSLYVIVMPQPHKFMSGYSALLIIDFFPSLMGGDVF